MPGLLDGRKLWQFQNLLNLLNRGQRLDLRKLLDLWKRGCLQCWQGL